MNVEDRIGIALSTAKPAVALRTLVQEFVREGKTKPEVYELLEASLTQIRTRLDDNESIEEAILDVMDAVSGWCHPDAELLPGEHHA